MSTLLAAAGSLWGRPRPCLTGRPVQPRGTTLSSACPSCYDQTEPPHRFTYRDGHLIIAGRSVPLTTAQSRSLTTVLSPALPDHPWPDTVLEPIQRPGSN